MMKRCDFCDKLITLRQCGCNLFYVKIPEWGCDEAPIYRDDHETAAADYVEIADCGDYTLANAGVSVEVLVRGAAETEWKKFTVEAEHTLYYHAKEKK